MKIQILLEYRNQCPGNLVTQRLLSGRSHRDCQCVDNVRNNMQQHATQIVIHSHEWLGAYVFSPIILFIGADKVTNAESERSVLPAPLSPFPPISSQITSYYFHFYYHRIRIINLQGWPFSLSQNSYLFSPITALSTSIFFFSEQLFFYYL